MARDGVRGLNGTANLAGRQTTGSMNSVAAATSHSAEKTTYTGTGAPSLNEIVKAAWHSHNTGAAGCSPTSLSTD